MGESRIFAFKIDLFVEWPGTTHYMDARARTVITLEIHGTRCEIHDLSSVAVLRRASLYDIGSEERSHARLE